MLLWIALLLVILVVFGFGFTVQISWRVAAGVLVLRGIGFFLRGSGLGGRSARAHR